MRRESATKWYTTLNYIINQSSEIILHRQELTFLKGAWHLED